jgi:ABC-2 type transport system permease protein
MSTIWTIAKRELKTFFDSLLAYIVIILFLLFTGFFTWLYDSNIFANEVASLQTFFSIAYWTLFFFIPILTMRSIAEERHSGTLEMILTKPVNEWQLVVGKYLAILILICVTLLLTIPYYITVASIGPIDHGATITGYLGLILLSAAYISIGIFASSLATNQIVSILLALFIGIFFHLIFGMVGNSLPGTVGNILDYLSASTHFRSVIRGVIDTRDILYYAAVVLLGLIGSEAVLLYRNVNEKA